MTRSWANWVAEGALIDRPGGGPFLFDVVGVRTCMPKGAPSCVLAPSLCSWELPGFPPFCLASMICLCCSRTSRLRCNWDRILGSFVWKPGDRHARPTSCMASPADSLADVNGAEGRAVCGPRPVAELEERSSRFGLGRADCMLGEPCSFLILIIGGGPLRRLAIEVSDMSSRKQGKSAWTYELGEIFPPDVGRSLERLRSPDAGEALLLARLDAGSAAIAALFGGAEAADGARAAKLRGEM